MGFLEKKQKGEYMGRPLKMHMKQKKTGFVTQAKTDGTRHNSPAIDAHRAAKSLSAKAHVSTLDRSPKARPFRVEQSLLQLQRQYGNRWVQRILKKKSNGGVNADATLDVENRIQRARHGGQALDRGVMSKMETSFGADFSNVRVHTDAGADNLNRALNARAFTTGQDIFFRQGEYNPGSSKGGEILAHELTHVLQQKGGAVQTKLRLGKPGDKYEQEADRTAQAVVKHQENVQIPLTQGMVHRQSAEDEEKIQTKAERHRIQRQAEEEEKEPVQMKKEDPELRRQPAEDELQMMPDGSEIRRQATEEEEAIE